MDYGFVEASACARVCAHTQWLVWFD